VILRVVNQSQ